MYTHQEWGNISVNLWQLLTYNQHLRDIVRDYCVQCGFFSYSGWLATSDTQLDVVMRDVSGEYMLV